MLSLSRLIPVSMPGGRPNLPMEGALGQEAHLALAEHYECV